jgi:asparagine synthetase B (glutamine-hydrolysing)
MCGIKWIVQTPYASRSVDLAAIRPMTARLSHRGPDAARVQNCWREQLSGRRDHPRTLWTVLMMQSWLETTVGYGTSRLADTPERPR